MQGNSGVGITGMRTTIKTGSLSAKFIPPIYIIIEDNLAKSVIDCLFEGTHDISRRYIYSGAWQNQASCLYGFLSYGMELGEHYNIPSFGVVAVTDGDISKEEEQKRTSKLIKGDHKNPVQHEILDLISTFTSSFTLEIKDKSIKALLEYNQKKWFEEITKDRILEVHGREGQSFARSEREISSMVELIELSKSISNDTPSIIGKKGNPDYHLYYEILKKFIPSNTDHKMNDIYWYVLSAIKHYNKDKWNFYTQTIKEKITALHKDHKNRFLQSNFDFR